MVEATAAAPPAHLFRPFIPVSALVVGEVECAGRQARFECQRYVGAGKFHRRVADAGADHRRVDERLILQIRLLVHLLGRAET